MPVTVVVGGQFGSEGKGKVAHFLVRHTGASVAVRVGGPNSGHTSYDDRGKPHIFRQLPTAALEPGTTCVLPAGSLIDVEVLRNEVERIQLSPERLIVDPRAYVITQEHVRREQESRLRSRIGSTLSGTGAAIIDRIQRKSADNLAGANPYLSRFTKLGQAGQFLRRRLAAGDRVVIEGTQGFGLSNIHSNHYPFTTSRDTTAATFVAETGLSPIDVDEIVLVVRAFPIRVAGNSGPLPAELDWETVAAEAGRPHLVERTTVTHTIRRVARFDPTVVRFAIESNTPTKLVLNHVDYLDPLVGQTGRLTAYARGEVSRYEEQIGRSFDWIGVSPSHLIPGRGGYSMEASHTHEGIETAFLRGITLNED